MPLLDLKVTEHDPPEHLTYFHQAGNEILCLNELTEISIRGFQVLFFRCNFSTYLHM
jgi:hypothetical protein